MQISQKQANETVYTNSFPSPYLYDETKPQKFVPLKPLKNRASQLLMSIQLLLMQPLIRFFLKLSLCFIYC